MELTKGKALELLNKSLPYPEQMRNIDVEKEGAIYFEWRSCRFKFELSPISVWSTNGQILSGDDTSMLLERLIKNNLGTVI